MAKEEKYSIVMDQLDAVDLKILREMQGNCRLTMKELAMKVNLSTTPVFERLKRLEKEGYISRYAAQLNAERLNMGFVVFCNVKLQCMNSMSANMFTEKMKAISEVAECYNVSGRFDYLLKIYASSMKHYRDFVLNTLGMIENIASIESSFVMAQIKADSGLPI